jgi:hypothetical protein
MSNKQLVRRVTGPAVHRQSLVNARRRIVQKRDDECKRSGTPHSRTTRLLPIRDQLCNRTCDRLFASAKATASSYHRARRRVVLEPRALQRRVVVTGPRVRSERGARADGRIHRLLSHPERRVGQRGRRRGFCLPDARRMCWRCCRRLPNRWTRRTRPVRRLSCSFRALHR